MSSNTQKDLVKAYTMGKDFRSLWLIFDGIQQKHVDGNTPWRDAEISLVTTKSHRLLNLLPKTKYNKQYREKALNIINLIITNPKDNDYFRMDTLKNYIHFIESIGCPDMEYCIQYDKIDKEYHDNWNSDKYAENNDIKFYTPANFPKLKSHDKKDTDIANTERFYFFRRFIELHGGTKLQDQYLTWWHDISNQNRIGKINIYNALNAIEACDKGKITVKQLISFTKRSLAQALDEMNQDDSTWGKDDAYKSLWAESYIIKFCLMKDKPIVTNCETINCNKKHILTGAEVTKMKIGEGVQIWWCDKHKESKKRNVYSND